MRQVTSQDDVTIFVRKLWDLFTGEKLICEVVELYRGWVRRIGG